MNVLSPSEQYLQDFHQRVAGATSAAFATSPAKTKSRVYKSSYEVLTSAALGSPRPNAVLDVACGDGHLLGLLAATSVPLTLVGLDMSLGELQIARAALPNHVLLLKERAQKMSLASGSIDVVVSHMALMLMDEIESVLAEIHRVLARDGTFAAMVGRTFLLGAVNAIFLDIFRPIAEEDLLPMPFGDRRTRSTEGWAELLDTDFYDLQFEDVDVLWQPTPSELWNALTETYDIDRLSDGARLRLKKALVAELSRIQDSEGRLQTGWGLRFIQARAR
ncbi:MAG TPA: methyltransferase domain-containing protein [Xanthobacteraceae bacterium]|nr:methyltransferase domain-containing protein [Xanthobacteraceae bacterium]